MNAPAAISLPQIALPAWSEPFLSRPARYKIAWGGRGSGKSWAFARMLLLRALARKTLVLCARELQNSVQDSVHRLLTQQIHMMGLAGFFTVQEQRIRAAGGSEFLFKGLRGMSGDASALKSLEGVDICWIEEGQRVSAASLKTLTPTIRAAGSEIWVSFNPDLETDPIYQLVKTPPPNAIIARVNWYDNPWFADTALCEEREWMQRTDPDMYRHVWEGECRQNSAAQVLAGKCAIEPFTPAADWDGPYYGADWGFSSDPTALIRAWQHERSLYIEFEAWGVGVELDDLPEFFARVPGAKEAIIRADAARPETIAYLQRRGWKVQAAPKWSGSVQDGISWLRGHERIVIHPRCTHAAEESRLWQYQTDRLTGDVLPKLKDGNEHCFDALRYALAPAIRQRQTVVSTARVEAL